MKKVNNNIVTRLELPSMEWILTIVYVSQQSLDIFLMTFQFNLIAEDQREIQIIKWKIMFNHEILRVFQVFEEFVMTCSPLITNLF